MLKYHFRGSLTYLKLKKTFGIKMKDMIMHLCLFFGSVIQYFLYETR